jgi:hypothetical protein
MATLIGSRKEQKEHGEAEGREQKGRGAMEHTPERSEN